MLRSFDLLTHCIYRVNKYRWVINIINKGRVLVFRTRPLFWGIKNRRIFSDTAVNLIKPISFFSFTTLIVK